MTGADSASADGSDTAAEFPSRLNNSTIVILCAALAIGTWARFAHLERFDMDATEALSWTAASAPNTHEVIQRALWLNPGKLGVHDAALHLWMRVFGDSLFALRGLSATLGVISILLTFVVVRELLLRGLSGSDGTETSRNWLAATTALLVATNLPMIVQSRYARMYMVLVPAILGQVWFFLRADRIGRWWNYVGLAACSLLAIATHFTAGSVAAAEVIWLASTLHAERTDFRNSPRPGRSLKIVGAIAVAGLILIPILRAPLRVARAYVAGNGFAWIRPPVL
ncbi:MAG TPA: glycosyltransferase family 39 protein, partial [Candidatus Binataceae bacterium]|nr:glycosyltransferase family 39 protein [Candidatus Binataceae bacterium]